MYKYYSLRNRENFQKGIICLQGLNSKNITELIDCSSFINLSYTDLKSLVFDKWLWND